MISVLPDPAHPRGGYAVLVLPSEALAGETTQVSVFDNYSERYLGETGWQPTQVLFGPYEVLRDADSARILLGPEIVNQIEEYANVKLEVGGVVQDLGWPDEVVPAPGAARIGGILAAGVKAAQPKGNLTAQMPPETGAESPPEEPIPQPIEKQADTDSGKGRMIIVLALLAAILAGAAYWYFATEAAQVQVDTPTPVAVPDDGPCSATALGGINGFAGQLEALRGCGSDASADLALGLLERAAAADNAQALALFGTVYDGQAKANAIEDQIGLTFGDVPATAAEYYARAVAAGSKEASEKLQVLCVRMADMTDTLARGAVADYCNQ